MTDLTKDTSEDALSIERDTDDGVYRVMFDATEVNPSTAVVEMIGEVSETETTELEPLYSAINPDALDSICTKQDREGDRSVEFSYFGYRVTVKSYGVITVQPRSENTVASDGE